tara:strand:+ start:100 stop:330 length:231 start_codon:yes stop_codon:yes gene_type:complete
MARKKKEVKELIVEEDINLVRDTASNAIINTNNVAYEARLAQIDKQKLDAQQSEDIVNLKKDVEEIKKLLKKIASK